MRRVVTLFIRDCPTAVEHVLADAARSCGCAVRVVCPEEPVHGYTLRRIVADGDLDQLDAAVRLFAEGMPALRIGQVSYRDYR